MKALEVQFLPSSIDALFGETVFDFNSREIEMIKLTTWKKKIFS